MYFLSFSFFLSLFLLPPSPSTFLSFLSPSLPHSLSLSLSFPPSYCLLSPLSLSLASLRREGYTVQVAVNDYLDIYCPHYNTSQRGTLERTVAEQYVLYMVSYRGYRTCDPQMGFKRWECNRPHAPHAPIKFSEKFQRYSAFSLGYEFNVGHEYYYICEWNIAILSLYRSTIFM